MTQGNYIRTHHLFDSFMDGLNYHRYQHKTASNNKKCLFLHGIRIAGLTTWNASISLLDTWDEILVPDLPGAGSLNPQNRTIEEFTLDDILHYLIDLVDYHGWKTFDVVGFSYGGYISIMLQTRIRERVQRQLLIEAALLVTIPEDFQQASNNLFSIAKMVETDIEEANNLFSNSINLKQRKFNVPMNKLPIGNPFGFGNLLMILAETMHECSIWDFLVNLHDVTSIITQFPPGRSLEMLQLIQKRHSWKIIRLPDCDHLSFLTNPQLLSVWLTNFYHNYLN